LDTYIKLPFSNSQHFNIDKNELIANSWIYSDNEFEQRIEFSNHEWAAQDDATYECYTHPSNDSLIYNFFSNRWRIFQYDENTYFVRTFSLFAGVLHEIIKITEDTIFTKAWIGNSIKYPTLSKIKNAPKSTIDSLANVISNKSWCVKKVTYSSDSLTEKSQKIINRKIDKNAYEGKMKFNFTSDKLEVVKRDSIIYRSHWKLSTDGKFIELSSDENISGYLEVIDINEAGMSLKNSPIFSGVLGLIYFTQLEMKILFE